MQKQLVINKVVEYVERNGTFPSRSGLSSVGVSRDIMRSRFGTMEQLFKEVELQHPDLIYDIKSAAKNKPQLKKSRVYVVTTAVLGAKVDTKFLKSLDTYCKHNKAELLISVATLGDSTMLDPILRSYNVITSDTQLNNNIGILGLKSSSKKTDPITGLPRIGQRNGSVIIPSPKQRLKYVATGPSSLPHALMSTGAITKPNYIKSTHLISNTDYIANHDHVMGALVIEIVDNKFFHFRQVQANANGEFSDLNKKYTPKSVKSISVSHLVLGDWHAGETCPTVAKQTLALAEKLKVSTFVMHDVFSATSCSHHDEGKHITKAMKADKNKLSLKDELAIYCNDLERISKKFKVVLVKSNHDEHLDRYLNEGRYVVDPQNHRLALELAAAMLDGHQPLQYYYSKVKTSKNNIIWLERDEYYVVSGIHLSAHGDKGANGSRGGINSLENAYGKVVFGHSHTPEIMRGAYCVGTSTATKPDYGSGPSSWVNTHCIVHHDGSRQLINMIDGRFTCML